MIHTCNQCGDAFEPKRPHARFCSDRCRAIDWRENGGEGAGERVHGGVGSQGGNVRSVQEARDRQGEQRPKRDWGGVIDEQIRRTLIETGYFHADDLDPLGVPPEHCNLKGSRSAWFRNKGFMESTGVYRKVAHLAANGRKAPTYRITPKGREKLVGVDANSSSLGGDGPNRALAAVGVDPGKSSSVGVSSSQEATEPNPTPLVADAGATPEPLSLLPQVPSLFDPDQRAA